MYSVIARTLELDRQRPSLSTAWERQVDVGGAEADAQVSSLRHKRQLLLKVADINLLTEP